MTNTLVVIINSLKVLKIKKILLYEMKFLVPNYSCLQNPWIGGTAPRSPSSLSSVLNWICWTPPPPQQNSRVRHYNTRFHLVISVNIGFGVLFRVKGTACLYRHAPSFRLPTCVRAASVAITDWLVPAEALLTLDVFTVLRYTQNTEELCPRPSRITSSGQSVRRKRTKISSGSYYDFL